MPRSRAKDHLSLWIQHLILNLVGKPGYPRKSLLMGLRDRKWWAATYAPVENSRELLEYLLRHLLERPQQAPSLLPGDFVPVCGAGLAQGHIAGKGAPPREGQLDRRRLTTVAEGQDLSLQLCFKSAIPWMPSSKRLSEAVFGPLLASRKEI